CLPVGFFVNLTPLLVIWGLKKFFEASLIVKNDRLAIVFLASLYFKVGHQACPVPWCKPLNQQSCFMALIDSHYTRSGRKKKRHPTNGPTILEIISNLSQPKAV
ncbi:hypothetical protein, partial [Leuconostoc falkenbergense]|uniref:hypothetical protein n=1 Tax=Leuconostoc falkenbergense TaxID=2766470 RepID=UPI0021A9F602